MGTTAKNIPSVELTTEDAEILSRFQKRVILTDYKVCDAYDAQTMRLAGRATAAAGMGSLHTTLAYQSLYEYCPD